LIPPRNTSAGFTVKIHHREGINMPASNHLPTPLQEYVHKSRYARWREDLGRREDWTETVQRYVDYFNQKFPHYPAQEIYDAILNLKTMPSMRALMTAGPALERDPMAGFNCSFVAVDDVRAFDEILYISMCGTGVGFSVERQFISKLPIVGAKVYTEADYKPYSYKIEIADKLTPIDHTIVVRDSKGGWSSAFRELLEHLYAGNIPKWDTSGVRPHGAKLKTFGGRASGPQPLIDLFNFAVETFTAAVGRKLTSIECHDLVCKIADIVVVGGVRRSALISLSNLSDDRMRGAKNGQWWLTNPHRALANNSAAYTERPQMELFLKEWLSLIESKSGERGIFNRQAVINKAIESGRRDHTQVIGTNPCAEIALRSMGLCNLSEVVLRSGDTLEQIKEKVRIAVIIGTYQSLLTDFRYVRPGWKANQEEERLLGVSLTGIMDHEVLAFVTDKAKQWLAELKLYAIEVNKEWAAKLDVNQSVAITTVKPSGTVSQLVDSASGKHERYARWYIRTVRGDKKDPLAQLMRKLGFPVEDCVNKPETTDVFSFPVEAPANSVFRNERTAVEQLEHYLMFQTYWSEHNVSNTIYVRDHEWLEVGHWVYKHFDQLAGVSFLPHSDHTYRQAPYTECSEDEFKALKAKMPEFDWEALSEFERDDSSVKVRELACTAGVCEIL
jgi:ribonucleoside-diphosphate reductase alpha chain